MLCFLENQTGEDYDLRQSERKWIPGHKHFHMGIDVNSMRYGGSQMSVWQGGQPPPQDGSVSHGSQRTHPGSRLSHLSAQRSGQNDTRGGTNVSHGGQQSRGMGNGGQQSRGMGNGGQQSRGMGNGGHQSHGMGNGGQQSRGVGNGGHQSHGMGNGGQQSRGMGNGGHQSRSMSNGEQHSLGMGNGGQQSRGMSNGGQQPRGTGGGYGSVGPGTTAQGTNQPTPATGSGQNGSNQIPPRDVYNGSRMTLGSSQYASRRQHPPTARNPSMQGTSKPGLLQVPESGPHGPYTHTGGYGNQGHRTSAQVAPT